MSGDGMKWAREQRASTPGGQLLLLELGLNASDLGTVVDLSIPRLADVTRQSRRTVSRLLAELEAAGAIERADAYDGTGGRRVIVRLKFDCMLDEATVGERAAMTTSDSDESPVSDDPKDETESGEGRANLARPRSRQTAYEVVPNSASGRANGDTTPYTTNLEEESLSSARARASEGEKERIEEFQKRLRDDWTRFAAVYPNVGAMDLARGEQEIGRLSLTDREVAIREAGHYAAEVKTAKKTFPKEAWRWLADRDFERLAELRKARGDAAGPEAARVPVRRPTPAGQAWDAYERDTGKRGFWTFSKEYGCEIGLRPTLFPPQLDPPDEAATGPPDDEPSLE